MAGQIVRHKCQASLGVPSSLKSSACGIIEHFTVGSYVVVVVNDFTQRLMIWDVEVLRLGHRVCLEPLKAIPGHILNTDNSTIKEEKEVEHAMSDNGIVGSLYHRR